ncbi:MULTISPECIES: MBL fold metallo-hydrolase [Pseudomonas]|jgi:glyoxylase-like metal-dependent hydrolase (beta-lactamase superfamily II)|uniref:Beta-lactamase domain protein n=1 Tax=Pseudomonas putida (strain W619) TaxID=390235 RepID=B1J198_PSEPW|nr:MULTISPECIES: MBL fold metallo-hydrolase [Pseudomonas]MDH1572473.1 MBL fold metallo-hydrolase [Pseudomonas sp. GD03746]QQE85090.1 MBL fold metallo-hydrolase [Pseudomonas putida]UTL82167.1 MBL fold metallo-hydrolase [Pseudomonas putida]HEN8709728.1 MBL fold metallo-hydrolase [Pseudomonas putida]HEN8715272.1 MBL fold metallo-hydrolase [Pseudomonas putida]
MSIFTPLRSLVLACVALAGQAQAAEPLQLDIYNPGHEAIFPVSSVIVSGEKDAILVDAQFGKAQAEQLVQRLRAGGKHLTTIYISHGDPDYYFGLDTLTQAFPEASVVASAATVAHIRQTMDAKLAYWGPQMGSDKPARLVVPQVLDGNRLMLEGQPLEVMGLDGPQRERSFVWIPSIKAVVGGVVVSENIHVWMADTQSAKSHADWLGTLKHIEQLSPRTVVPGHYLGQSDHSLDAVHFTASYIQAFDVEAAKAKDADGLIAAMKKRYPGLADESSLELGAKVAKGEMKW